MKKVLVSILAVIGGGFVILLIIGFLNKQPSTQPTQSTTSIPQSQIKETANVFQEQGWGFKIEYPTDWIYEKVNDYTVIFSGPENTETFYTTLNIQKIAATKIGGEYSTADALLQSLKNQIATAQNSNSTEVADMNYTSKTGETILARGFIAQYTRQNENFQQLQLVIKSNDGEIFYAIAYTAPADLYDKYKSTIIMIMESLVLLK